MTRMPTRRNMSAARDLGLVVVLVAASLLFGATGSRPAAAATQNAIQIENAKPGTSSWNDFSAIATQDAINGYGSKISVNHGDSIDLYVTTTAANFTIDIFRTGWYGGVGARLVASLGSFTGVHQAIPAPDAVTGMVAATSWTKTTTLAIPSDWVTGVYLAKLTASNGNKSFILFVVRNDGGTEPIMFQTSVTTAQAYNVWGGTSLYTNEGNKAVYPYAAATKVSFDRPFDPRDGDGAGQYFAFEYPFVRWAESQGYDLTYITNIDTHTNVNPLTNHRLFMSIGHDEYWSRGMRDNVSNAIAHGVNAAFFSANSMYWQIRLESNSAGTANRVEVGYKDSSQFNTPPGPDPMYGVNNAIVTSRWRDAPVSQPENAVIGVMYQDQVQRNYDYVVQNAGNWIYAGTGFAEGTHVPGIVGYEYDKVWSNGFSPPGLTVLSNSPVVGCCEGSGNSFSNSTLYTAASGAQVFASGTIQWSWGLDGFTANFVNAGIQKTTANILAAFSAGTTTAPAVSLAPTGLVFGSQLVGTTSGTQSVTLTNSGNAPLTISSVAVTGANAGDYTQTNTCPLTPSTVAAGGTCQIAVKFTPGATGTRTASVTIGDDAGGSPHGVTLSGTGSPRSATAMPLISRGVPAFASSQIYPASNANDGDYSSYWNGSIPSSLSYDLSSVSVAQRGKVIVAWYNDPQTSSYDHGIVGDLAYNIPRDYTIQANAAPGGGAAPASSWVTLVTVTGNGYHSREHLVDLTGYNWIRISVTASDGSSGNTNAVLNLDVHDASLGVGDSSIFFGDSIAMDALHHEPINGTGNYSQLVSAARPGFYPAYEDGGTGGIGSLDGATHIGAWLNAFPGRYVGIALGTNDANGCGDTTAFYNNYVAMVQAVLGAGKVPIVPTIPWARTANIQSCGPAFNAKIQALYTAFPQVDRGPDLWAYYQANQSLISSDDLHPTTAGYAAYRQQWVNTMLATYYGGGGPAPAVTLTPASLAFASQVVGSTSTSQTSTLKNTGTASLTITSVGLTGANPGDFTQANDCPASLAANATCTITVAFRPTATGSRSASVAITDNAVGSPHNVTLTGTGTASSVTLTPASLAFGSLAIGSTSAPQTSTLQNTGTAPLTVSGIALTGTNPGDFTQANDCPASLAVSATCTITVSFKPTATGSRSANVSVTDSAPGSPHAVALSGTGTTSGGASIAFDKSLGARTDNAAGTTMALTTNAAAVTGSRVFAFVVWNDAARTLTSVTGGALTWTVDVQSRDDNNDHVAIASADAPLGLASGTVLTATFSGSVTHGLIAGASFTGVSAGAFLDATGNRVQGAVTAWNATVTTTVPGDLVLAYSVIDANTTSTATTPNVEIHDFGDASYYGWSTSTYRLAASAGATTVNGTWASASGAVGTVTVAAAYKPAGGGTPTPAVTLSPTSLVFGAQAVGTTSASQSVTLTNSGTGPVTITSITVAGTNAADFGRTTTCPLSPTTLAAGASCTIGATFAPAAAGARAASIQVADNATGSPHTVALSGTGTAPAVTLTPTNLVFGSQLVGTTSASQSSTLRNSGTASLTIASITVVGANAGEFGQTNDCPVSLAANATCTITVTFSPSATGSRAATVQISDNAVGSPHALTLSGTGATPVPAVTLSPTSLAFGSQLVGTTSASQSSTLKNTGTGPMTITSIGLTGANAGDFGQSNSCPGSLAANATCTITVTFSPTVSGGRAASVSIADDAPGTPHTIPLSGNGTTPAPAVMLTPTSLTFASQLVGSTSASQSSMVKNTGTDVLTITSIGMTGTNAADFGQTNDCPATLAVNGTCTISVTFSPTAGGSRVATVSIVDNAASSPDSVTLGGTGVTPAPAVTLTPASLGFGSVRVGTTSASQLSTLKDTGTAPLTITGITMVGANAGDFAQTNDCPGTLAVNATCTITVTFSPTATGVRAANAQITDDAGGSPQSIALSGTGTAPAVTLSPTTVNFGSQRVGTTSAAQTVNVMNTGTAALSIASIGLAGTNAGDFSQSTTCALSPATLAAGASCTISVRFAPTAAGARSASLQIADDASGSPHSVALSGTGTTTAIAFDKSLGTKSENANSASMTLTTSGTAVAGARVFVFVSWTHSTRTLTSVSGGGLTWTVDRQQKAAGNNARVAIASAAAPTGLASGVVLTATFSGPVTHGLIAATSFTGIATSAPVDATAGATGTGTAWTASATTTNANDLVLGFSTIDANATSTATAPNTEIHDFGNASYYGWATSVYRIETTTGAKTTSGTWSTSSGSTGNVTIAVAYKAG